MKRFAKRQQWSKPCVGHRLLSLTVFTFLFVGNFLLQDTSSAIAAYQKPPMGPQHLATPTKRLRGNHPFHGKGGSVPRKHGANPTPISFSNINGSFFNNPNNSGPFDVNPQTPPVFQQTFPIMYFNPPTNLQNCTNNTNVDENTRPFTDVSPNQDGSCTTIIVQGNGEQAGVGNLYNFEAVYLANITVPAAGLLTTSIFADDGWILSIGPDSSKDQPFPNPTNIMTNPPSGHHGPFTGYPEMGDNNAISPPASFTIEEYFPAAGTYPVELDYTECCGGQLTLLATNTFIPDQGPQGTERLGDSNPSELGYCRSCAGDPIDTYSGNFTHTFTDFFIPGRGIPLQFSRTYNAQAASQNGPLGYGWTDPYNMSLTFGQQGSVTVNQEDGSTVTFTPNQQGGYTAPPRVLSTLVRNQDSSYTFSRKDQTHYTFNSNGPLTQEVDRNGYSTSFTYQNNQLSAATDPAGRSLTFTWTGSNITKVTDPLNRSISFTYDQNGNLITATDVNGGITTFTYDSNHLLLSMKDPNGGVVTNIYDSNNRVTSQKDAMGRTTTFSYGTNQTTITDPNSNVTVEQYQNAVLVSRTRGYGTKQAATWSYIYDPNTLGLIATTDPNGHVWSKTWDSLGNLLSSTDPLGRTISYTYDSFNDVTSITDPNGITTTYTYDGNGNLLSVSRPLIGPNQTQTTTYTYGDSNHPGDITAMTDPDGQTWTYTYDADGNRTSVTDPLGDVTSYQYNGIGWKTAQVSPKKNTTGYLYNNFGDITLITDPLGHKTTQQYDANRNLIQVTDAAGNVTRYAYDLDNELTQVTGANGSLLTYSYDDDGNRTAEKDGLGNVTSYSYGDPAYPGNATTITDPLKHTTAYSYDGVGNRVSLTAPAGQVTTSTYDAANELTGINYSDGKTPDVSFSYDKDGQRLSMADGTGTTTYTYDSLNRLMQSTNGAGSTVGYSYDLIGQLTSLNYPNGNQVTQTYDAAGRLTSVKDWLGNTTSFSYDADSNLVGQTYPNQVKETLTYDLDDQVISITNSLAGKRIFSFGYTRTPLELLATLQPRGVPQQKEQYSYTSLNQVSAVNQLAYKYDYADNLTLVGTTSQTYDAANEVTSQTTGSSTTTFNYDVQGNRMQKTAPSKKVTTYTYDQANRLTAIRNSSTTAQYAYNGNGLRMSKTVNKTPEAFIWDVARGLPLLLQDGAVQYVYGPGGLPLEQVSSNGTVLYYHHDQLGSTRALTDSLGHIVGLYTYDAFGNLVAKKGKVANPFQYAGQYTDAETGFQYLRARYYDPRTGQFMTRDLLAALTHERYALAYNDPLNRTDSSGLLTVGPCFSGSGGYIGGGTGEICLMINLQGIAVTLSGGGGFQSPDIPLGTPIGGASVGIQVNTANLADLGGSSPYYGGSGGLLGKFGLDIGGQNINQYSCGQPLSGASLLKALSLLIPSSGEISAGLGSDFGGEFHTGISKTKVLWEVMW